METNEIMTTNEEAMETVAEEIVKASSGSGLKTAAGFGLGVLAGMLICKFAKPVITKVKNRKGQCVKVIAPEDAELADFDVDAAEETDKDVAE